MLQAMNTGHDGSMSTGHANTPRDMLARLETMVLFAGVELPLRAVREQIASAVDLIVHQDRLKDGTRKITNITEVQGMEGDVIVLQDVFIFEQTGISRGQGPGPPAANRRSAALRREVRGARHPPAAAHVREPVLAMDPITILVAAGAAVGVLLIFVSLAGGSDVNARLERYASAAPAEARLNRVARPWRAHRLIGRAGQLQPRRREARLGQQPGARAGPGRPRPQAERVPGHPRRRDGRRAAGHDPAQPVRGRLREPARLDRRARARLLAAALLAQSTQGQAAQGVQQRPGRHDHAARQLAARRLVVPPGGRDDRARDAATHLDRVRARHPRGQPGPAARRGAGQPPAPRALGRPRPDDHGHRHPPHGRRQPRRDPRHHRLHDPRAGPHQGRDPDPDRAAAHVGLRRRLPARRAW